MERDEDQRELMKAPGRPRGESCRCRLIGTTLRTPQPRQGSAIAFRVCPAILFVIPFRESAAP